MLRARFLWVVLAIAVGAWLLLVQLRDQGTARDASKPAEAAEEATPAGLPAPPHRKVSGDAASAGLAGRPSTPAAGGGGVLVLPTGEWVPALNGVTDEIRLLWPAETPYSPITGTARSDGIEWYVHADGSLSTTQMIFRSDLGRKTAMSMVASPRPALLLQPDRDSAQEPAAREGNMSKPGR